MTSAVSLQSVSKKYRLYHERPQTLKEAVLQRRLARFEELWALRDVSLEIPSGCTYGLIGPNGSGKSTALRIAAGIQPPTSGRVRVNGRVAAMLELGAGFHPELTGRENTFLSGSILGLDRKYIERAMDSIVEFSGLSDFIDVPVKVYSTGMFVRLGFSVAVHLDAEILLIDEVISVGDEEFQHRALDHIDKLRGEGATIIFVSHSLELIRRLCDRVAWLDHGRVTAEGEAEDITIRYLDTSVDAESAEVLHPEHPGQVFSGGGSIVRFEILNSEGKPIDSCATHDQISVRIHYSMDREVEDVAFTISFGDVNGTDVTLHSTAGGGRGGIRLAGEGHLDYVIPALPLLPGVYGLSAWLYTVETETVMAHEDRTQTLRVLRPDGLEPMGIVDLNGRWKWPPG